MMKLWTLEDRAGLYRALEYQEGQPAAQYPKHVSLFCIIESVLFSELAVLFKFVDKKAKFTLKKLSIRIYDETGHRYVSSHCVCG